MRNYEMGFKELAIIGLGLIAYAVGLFAGIDIMVL